MTSHEPKTKEERQVFSDGYDAGADGRGVDENPHPKGTRLHEMWEAGLLSYNDDQNTEEEMENE